MFCAFTCTLSFLSKRLIRYPLYSSDCMFNTEKQDISRNCLLFIFFCISSWGIIWVPNIIYFKITVPGIFLSWHDEIFNVVSSVSVSGVSITVMYVLYLWIFWIGKLLLVRKYWDKSCSRTLNFQFFCILAISNV